MKAIFINSEKKEVTEIEIGKDYQDIYPYVAPISKLFTVPVILSNEDSLYVDDEGLLHGPVEYGFQFTAPDDTVWILAGNGLLLGGDDEGNSVDVKYPIGHIRKMVEWMDANEMQDYQREVGFL